MKELMILINALIMVESNGNDGATGDYGAAIGCLQIHQCVVEDVNGHYNLSFRHDDGYDRATSILICILYFEMHVKSNWNLIGDNTDFFYERCSRIWNGGPNGYKKDSTLPYWHKVQAELERQAQCVKK